MDDASLFSRRILDRAEKHMIFEHDGLRSSDLSEDLTSVIFCAIGKEVTPLITFWESQDKWTVVTWDHLYSMHNGSFVSCHLDDIKDGIEGIPPDSGKHRRETLRTTEILYLKNPKIFVWAPAGEAISALWHILKYCRPKT